MWFHPACSGCWNPNCSFAAAVNQISLLKANSGTTTAEIARQIRFLKLRALNVITKSGTNRFTGNLFEFLRDNRFNATNPFARVVDGKRLDDGLKVHDDAIASIRTGQRSALRMSLASNCGPRIQ